MPKVAMSATVGSIVFAGQFPAVVDLNVGGRHFTTHLSTLTQEPDSMLAAMFSGRHAVSKDKDGRIFIDADGEVFFHILNFLRFKRHPPSDTVLMVYEQAVHFGLRRLVDVLEVFLAIEQQKRLEKLRKLKTTKQSLIINQSGQFPAVVDLNVGGRHFTTHLSTLTQEPDSMLAAMFSGRHAVSKDKDGRIFIDADGEVFPHILNFLRFKRHPPSDTLLMVYEQAVYFELRRLVAVLETFLPIKQQKHLEKLRKVYPWYREIVNVIDEAVSRAQMDAYLITYRMPNLYTPDVWDDKFLCQSCFGKKTTLLHREDLSGDCLKQLILKELSKRLYTNVDVTFLKTCHCGARECTISVYLDE